MNRPMTPAQMEKCQDINRRSRAAKAEWDAKVAALREEFAALQKASDAVGLDADLNVGEWIQPKGA